MERIATFNVVPRKNIVHEREYDYWRRGLFESNSKKLEDMFGNADGFKWLTQQRISLRFGRDVSTILRWIANVFDEGELEGKNNLQKMQISSSDKLFMGLFAFSGNQVTKKDIGVAKNYLTEDELQNLNMLVSGYFDIAELRAVRHIPTTMQDFIEQLDQVLTITDSPVLNGSGKRSHKQAMAKAEEEYRKYQNKTLSPVEEEYFKQLAAVERDLSKRSYSDSTEND